ncbi:MAG: hypothetical protein WD875_19665 [Pirellulales bacterium]
MKYSAEDIPEEFAYLREAVVRFGHLSHHEVILDFLESKTDDDLALLRDVGEKMLANEHERRIIQWLRRLEKLSGAVSATLSLMSELGIPPPLDYAAMPVEAAKEKLRQEWDRAEPYEYCWLSEQTRQFFEFAEGRSFVVDAIAKARRKDKRDAVLALYSFPAPENVSLVEEYWRSERPQRRPQSEWGTLAAISLVDWPKLCDWLAVDGALRDVAIDALQVYCFDRYVPTCLTRPKLPGFPGEREFAAYLRQILPHVEGERQRKWIERLIENAGLIKAG